MQHKGHQIKIYIIWDVVTWGIRQIEGIYAKFACNNFESIRLIVYNLRISKLLRDILTWKLSENFIIVLIFEANSFSRFT